MPDTDREPPRHTPLHGLHAERGAKMVTFSGYEMPVRFPAGILAEHRHTRAAAGLFDVSHMGQIAFSGADAAARLEALVPGDILGLAPGRMRYTQLTNEAGGILDDFMVTNRGDHLFLVVNAGCKAADLTHLRAGLGDGSLEMHEDRALLALQGPAAVTVLARFAPDCAELTFMSGRDSGIDGVGCFVTRSGYTGEDGFEISCPAGAAESLARRLLDEPEVEPIGLGARDSLRLEAGLCLYGHDIDAETSPVEAGLLWSIGKRRRAEGGFPGAAVIQRQIAEGPARRRVGILPDDRAPAREHTQIKDQAGTTIGAVTSGGFAPSLDRPIAMGYVRADRAAADTPVELMVRTKGRPGRVTKLPFRPARYHKRRGRDDARHR